MSQADIERSPGYLVKRVQQRLRRACDERLRTTGVSMAQYTVLRAVDDHPNASSAELARLCFVTRQSLRDVLNGLKMAGTATVAERAETGRARPVSLTEAGRDALRAADAVVRDVEERMLANIPAHDRARLSALLETCAANLGER